MKFQNHISDFEGTNGCMNGQAQSNMPLQLFQSWDHKNGIAIPKPFRKQSNALIIRLKVHVTMHIL